MEDQIIKKEFGATVIFAEDGHQMNFQFNSDDDPDHEDFWDFEGSSDTYETLEDAISHYRIIRYDPL